MERSNEYLLWKCKLVFAKHRMNELGHKCRIFIETIFYLLLGRSFSIHASAFR